jgi:hypothetical protein
MIRVQFAGHLKRHPDRSRSNWDSSHGSQYKHINEIDHIAGYPTRHRRERIGKNLSSSRHNWGISFRGRCLICSVLAATEAIEMH